MSLIIVDSLFGNTATVADAVAQGIGCSTEVIRIGQPRSQSGVLEAIHAHATGLLVIGGPTTNRGMSPRLSSTLDALDGHMVGLRVAAFDTRLRGPGLFMGSAAKQAVKRLQAGGAHLLVPPESFYVNRTAAPGARPQPEDVALIDGEFSRARVWGARLAGAIDAAWAA